MNILKSVKNTLVLVSICAVVAVALSITNYFTAPIIAERDAAAANEALLQVLPEGGSFDAVDLTAYTLPATVTEAYKASNGGYVFKLTTAGYGPNMVLMCGVNPDGTVSGAVCLSSNETLGKEKTYGDTLVGVSADTVDGVDTLSGATMTTSAYRSAVKDALNAAIILGGGSVDIRTEEEILADNLKAALPAANGEFTKLFIAEEVSVANTVYLANNGSGAVCVIDEQFIGVDAEGNVITEGISADLAASVSADLQKLYASTKTAIDLTTYEGLPTALLSAEITASGNYILELRAAGFGITGDEWYRPSGEYIYIRVSMTAEGKIIDCLTVSQKETDGLGSVCGDEKFYGQFDGKTQENYADIDAISGATTTTDAYKTAILRAFEAVEILKGGEGE